MVTWLIVTAELSVALGAVMSLVAMWLMARKHIESWIYWIVVDVIGIWLYFVKDVRFISLLYVVLLVLAIRGLFDWRRTGRRTASERAKRGRPYDNAHPAAAAPRG
jgi:nicotinamide mononucleotide transporter PnuC